MYPYAWCNIIASFIVFHIRLPPKTEHVTNESQVSILQECNIMCEIYVAFIQPMLTPCFCTVYFIFQTQFFALDTCIAIF